MGPPPSGDSSSSPKRKRKKPLMVGRAGERAEEDVFVDICLLTDFKINHRFEESVFKIDLIKIWYPNVYNLFNLNMKKTSKATQFFKMGISSRQTPHHRRYPDGGECKMETK